MVDVVGDGDDVEAGALRESGAGEGALLADELEQLKALLLPLGQRMLLQEHGTSAKGHPTIFNNFRKFVNPSFRVLKSSELAGVQDVGKIQQEGESSQGVAGWSVGRRMAPASSTTASTLFVIVTGWRRSPPIKTVSSSV